MDNKIIAALKNIELEHQCQILYACESGSRAWGFASPDSDYDVRFVYVNPLKWYLALEDKTDVINKMLPGDLDLSGWELQKTLRFFAKCNLCLNEWLGSPIVYYKNEKVFSQLKVLIESHFDPRKAIHHYSSTAKSILSDHLHGTEINIKKLFYILRPLLACLWIMHKKSMPPTQFKELLNKDYLSSELLEFIKNLLVNKSSASEQDRIQVPKNILKWIDDQIILINVASNTLSVGSKPKWKQLDSIIFEMFDIHN